MGSEWTECLFETAPLQIQDGDRGKNYPKTSEFTPSGHCIFLNTSNVTQRGFNLQELNFISSKRDNLLKKGKLQRNDIVLTTRGTVGNVAYFDVNIPYNHIRINSGMVILRPDGSILDSRYLYLFMRSKLFKVQAESLMTGSAQPQLPVRDIKKIRITYPEITEQKTIAHILGTLDDKIELNRQMNGTLESMAQALFKSWFVDFDPVIDNALAAGNPIPEPLKARAENRKRLGDQRKPLPQEVQQQFPDRFVFTEELGWVPEGWCLKSLDEIANYQNGLALQKFRPEYENDFLPVVKIAHLKKGYADGEEKASPNIKPECIIDDGDVVFSWSGSLMVDVWCGGKAALNQHLFKVTSLEYPKWFYYEYTKHHLANFQRIAADKAVTMGHIKKEHLSQAVCIIPPPHFFGKCSLIFVNIIDKMVETRIQTNHLANLRDTLLPKLISGQLRLPDSLIDKFAEQANSPEAEQITSEAI